MSAIDLSVVIPVYNRGDIIRHTLESVRRAAAGLRVETLVVDDGSTEPVADTIARLGYAPETRVIRQENRGLLFARLHGLDAATGDHVLFLDSDDLVSPGKFRAQLSAMAAAAADISYTDTARATLAGDDGALDLHADPPAAATSNVAAFCITVQPPPHSPIWRRDFLRRTVDDGFIPASPLYNSVAEIWFYHNAAILPGRVVKAGGPHTIIGQHPGERLTNHWERLGVASLAVMEAFARHCPRTDATRMARQLVAEKAFRSWRKLPRGFCPKFSERELNLWRTLQTEIRLDALGGSTFRMLARMLGPVAASRLLHVRNAPYDACRTMTDAALAALLENVPAP